ncbi:fimbrial protein [Bordetella genomosp. 9]|uniref:Fimbrial protein n=1 Tax=Bordetella genomosp. 9 TaxID=1416803 RepID=A0A261R990_9BORD|nr:fimbrial protein [Bordetella genomosp. 9]
MPASGSRVDARRRWERWLPCLLGGACLALCIPARAQSPSSPAAHEVYLSVNINGQATTLISRFRELNGHLFISPGDLASLGLKTGSAAPLPDRDIALDAIAGIRYRYNPGQQTVDIEAPNRLLKAYSLDTRGLEPAAPAASGTGLLLNYDAYGQTGTNDSLAVWSEERYFGPSGVLSNTGIAYLYGPYRDYVRYDTSWSHSDPATLRTTQFGDTISSSLPWSRSVRMGGLQWRRNFGLRPDLVTFPLPALSGTAVVPSAIDVYINNIRQYSGNVPGGPFVVNNVPGITGAGVASIVTRDALGRPVSTSLPIYIDSRLLAQGLSSYSAEAGFLRRDYGLRSFDYDSSPAGSLSGRYGVSDALTVEGHAESTPGMYNAGGGALVRLGTDGVLDGSLSVSAGRQEGAQAGVGYQYIRPDFSFDIRTLRKIGNYGDLASSDGTPTPDVDDRITFSIPIGKRQTVSLSYIGLAYPGVSKSDIGSISYAVNLGQQITFNVNAFQDFSDATNTGVFLSLSIGLGDNTVASLNAGEQNGRSTYTAGAVRTPDYGGGWGWGAQAGSTGAIDYQQGWGQYLGRYGQVTATAQNLGGRSDASLDLNGGVVLMGGHVEASRQIYDGFALVSTDGIGGVPVLSQNRVIGATSSDGYLLVPNLNGYQNNQIAIDSLKLPPDTRVEATEMDVVPQALSGVTARFALSRYSAASIVLRDQDGKPLPVGTRVHHDQGGQDTIVGYDGITFVDHLRSDNSLRLQGKQFQCEVRFAYRRPADGSLPTIGPLTCVRRPRMSP